MAYTVEDINGCTKKISFHFEDVDLTTQIESGLKEKQKSSNLKGFRQGKAPIELIKKIYGPQVENDALYHFLSDEFYKTIQSEELKAVGYPRFANTKFEEGKKVSFEATVEVLPELELKDYSSYKFNKADESVSEQEVTDLEKRYLESKAQQKELTDESATLSEGHFAVLNFEGEKEDGSRPENMKGSEFLLEIGSGNFIEGFEEKMIGMKKGEKRTLDLTFPETYHEESLRNAKVKFHVELLEIKEKTYPELSDELAVEFGFENLEDFKTKNRKNLENQKKREVLQNLHQEILNKFIDENPFDIPSALLEQQKKSVREELGQTLKSQGLPENMLQDYYTKWDADIAQKAEFQVRSGLILDKLAKEFDVKVEEADLDAKINEMSEANGMDKEQLTSMYKGNPQLRENLTYGIREEKTFDKLAEKMSITTA